MTFARTQEIWGNVTTQLISTAQEKFNQELIEANEIPHRLEPENKCGIKSNEQSRQSINQP
jgi:hypothetical protein